jgi:hypothetical protein
MVSSACPDRDRLAPLFLSPSTQPHFSSARANVIRATFRELLHRALRNESGSSLHCLDGFTFLCALQAAAAIYHTSFPSPLELDRANHDFSVGMRRSAWTLIPSTSTSTSIPIVPSITTFYITLFTLLSLLTPLTASYSLSPRHSNANAVATTTTDALAPRDTKPFLLRVMPLGASITVGYQSSDGNGYRKPLREQLRYAGWEVDMVGSLTNGTMKDNVRYLCPVNWGFS